MHTYIDTYMRTYMQAQLRNCQEQIKAMEREKFVLQQSLEKTQHELLKAKQVIAKQNVSFDMRIYMHAYIHAYICKYVH